MTELLTALETAQLLRCSLRTLDRERSDGRGCPFVRIGGRIRYRRADVEAFITAHVRGHVTGGVPNVGTLRRRGRLRKRFAERRAAS
jgi:excisionase family DNA binding protein